MAPPIAGRGVGFGIGVGCGFGVGWGFGGSPLGVAGLGTGGGCGVGVGIGWGWGLGLGSRYISTDAHFEDSNKSKAKNWLAVGLATIETMVHRGDGALKSLFKGERPAPALPAAASGGGSEPRKP